MSLPLLPLLTNDDSINIDLIYTWLGHLITDFPNAVGSALDPANGEGGDNALSITELPTGISFATGSTTSVDGVLSGYIDISFVKPNRAVDVEIKYSQVGQATQSVAHSTTSPFRLSGLSMGQDYEIQLAGRAANNSVGEFTPVYTVTINATGTESGIPINVTATGTFQSVVLEWDSSSGLASEYEVYRALDAAFTSDVHSWYIDATKMVDDTGLADTTYYYKVRSVDTSGGLSDFSLVVSATTTGISEGDLAFDINDHIHRTTRLVADGISDIFELVDYAEYIDLVTLNGAEVDPFEYASPVGLIDRVVLDTMPSAGDIIIAHYVISRL